MNIGKPINKEEIDYEITNLYQKSIRQEMWHTLIKSTTDFVLEQTLFLSNINPIQTINEIR